MGAWRNATLPAPRWISPELTRPAPTSTNAGVLRPADGSGVAPVYRPPAGRTVADFVERYWSVSWSTDAPTRREVITHPAFHLTVTTGDDENGSYCRAVVNGVVTRTFAVDLHGRGRVVGAKFRPGGFTALTGRPAYAFTDRRIC